MSLREVVERTWEKNLLFSALLELTYRCNLDCAFCYNDLGLRGRALSREQYLKLLADLAELGTLNLILSGGEPLAHPDFFLLGARARELGFLVRVKSNGHALRGELVRRLREEVDPFLLEISLHGARAETHDRQTRVAGSFDRLRANLGELLAAGLRIKLNVTLTCWNEGEVEAMYALADGLGVPLQFDPEVTPKDDGDAEPLALRASEGGLRRLFAVIGARAEARRLRGAPADPPVAREGEQLSDGARPGFRAPAEGAPSEGAPPGGGAFAGGKHCGAGSASIAVDPYGNVYPCVQWRRAVGNLHEVRLAELWRGSSRVLAEVREAVVRAGETVAAAGEPGLAMGFCPGLAETLTGRPDQLYPGARERLVILGGK